MVWSQLAEIKTPPVVTTDFLSLRLIGERSIQEKDFGRIQIDRVVDMQKWVDNLKTVEDERIKVAIITANNHYAGFGSGTVNIFRNILGMPEAKEEVGPEPYGADIFATVYLLIRTHFLNLCSKIDLLSVFFLTLCSSYIMSAPSEP